MYVREKGYNKDIMYERESVCVFVYEETNSAVNKFP